MTSRSPTLDALEMRRSSIKPEARALVRLLAEQIDAGRLRLARNALGLTQNEVAEITGVTQADISRIESGQVSPTVDRLSRMLRLLHEWAEDS